ncbi:MAG TPA: helix-turn-helix domain-containing protein [Gemmatimonas sp.]|nr:helix-turn-helix domain-containing protein [Gemmatimonas sp.]
MSPLVPNSYSYTLGVGALNGFIVAILLLRARGQRLANRLLAGLVAVVALRLVPYILGYAGFYDAYPWLSFAPFDHPLAVGPLLWLYVVVLTEGVLPRGWRWHLLPAAVHAALWSAVFIVASVPQKTAISDELLPFITPVIAFGGSAGFGWYTLLAFRRYEAYQRYLDDNLSSREEYRLGWLRALIVLLGVTAVVMTAFVLAEWFVAPLDYFDEYPLYLWLAILCYAVGLLAWRGSATVYPVPGDTGAKDAGLLREIVRADDRQGAADGDANNETSSADERSIALSEGSTRAEMDWQVLGERYAAEVRAGEWWRDTTLTLPVLARKLGSNTTYLSRALNTGLDTTFNGFVNRLRAEAVAERLRKGDDRELLDIARESGFNSKASFQRAFREHVGGTPGEYRRRVREDGMAPGG